jgi:F-type H+-transporting ATPase subunit a
MGPIWILAADPVGHVVDWPLITNADGTLWYVSNASVMLVLGAIVTALLVIPAARRIATGVTGRSVEDYRAQGLLANMVEAVCLYLREQVFRPVLEHETDKYAPILWTFFWFILVCNLLGLVPLLDLTAMLGWGYHGHGIGGTATQSIWVTGALASLAFVFYNGVAFVKDPVGFLKHLTAGAPWFLWPIMVIVEILGMVVKPVALALRLFANMTGGHIILAVLLSFVPAVLRAFDYGAVGWGLSIIPLLGSVAIYLLEILVAFIQAFIFTFLTTLFLGQLVVHEHEEHEEHEMGDHGMETDIHTAIHKRDVSLKPSTAHIQ